MAQTDRPRRPAPKRTYNVDDLADQQDNGKHYDPEDLVEWRGNGRGSKRKVARESGNKSTDEYECQSESDGDLCEISESEFSVHQKSVSPEQELPDHEAQVLQEKLRLEILSFKKSRPGKKARPMQLPPNTWSSSSSDRIKGVPNSSSAPSARSTSSRLSSFAPEASTTATPIEPSAASSPAPLVPVTFRVEGWARSGPNVLVCHPDDPMKDHWSYKREFEKFVEKIDANIPDWTINRVWSRRSVRGHLEGFLTHCASQGPEHPQEKYEYLKHWAQEIGLWHRASFVPDEPISFDEWELDATLICLKLKNQKHPKIEKP
ncbi:hypothetical protein BT63DRAFT_482779 [Microthyrium microscopicum]|uniref:Uncharacterized protein n=1 Tax=Microthyrium microscopicum TaxID=703497 RepID=A0A6A6TZW6_9PEZI|nr:hypothetical protein BT63DRAFT_482779 [Microthyrium microscopicum]